MQKYIKYGIILIVVLVVLIVLKYLLTPDMNTQLKNDLLKQGYVQSSDTLFVKNNIKGYENSFSLADYTFMQKVDETSSGVNSYFFKVYDYKDEKITYNYRVTHSEGVNIIYRGSYTKDNFVCNKEFSTGKLTESEKNSFCELIKIGCETFEYEAKNLFSKNKFIKYIKEK